MDFIAHINVMPHEELLDPQGKAVLKNLKNIEVTTATNVRIGKHITLEFSADSEEAAEQIVHHACKNLLVNVIVEQYEFSLEKA